MRRMSSIPSFTQEPSAMSDASFSHAEKGLTRFPPNVEQISVEHEETCTWLVTRRNDVLLRFPLSPDDCQHLANLLHPKA
jgi:hypothetical protein